MAAGRIRKECGLSCTGHNIHPLCVVQGGVYCDILPCIPVEQQLEMMLGEIVALVGIESGFPFGISVFPTRIIAPAI